MSAMRILALIVSISASAPAVAQEATPVVWKPGNPASSTLLVEILGATPSLEWAERFVRHEGEPLAVGTTSVCEVKAQRPGLESGPITSSSHQGRCDSFDSSGALAGRTFFDLSEEPLHRYGSTFTAKGFTSKDGFAAFLTESLRRLYRQSRLPASVSVYEMGFDEGAYISERLLFHMLDLEGFADWSCSSDTLIDKETAEVVRTDHRCSFITEQRG